MLFHHYKQTSAPTNFANIFLNCLSIETPICREFETDDDNECIWHNTFESIEVDLDSEDSDIEIESNSPPVRLAHQNWIANFLFLY